MSKKKDIQAACFMAASTSPIIPVRSKIGRSEKPTSLDPLAGICESLRAKTPIPQNKRSGPSILEGLPDIHDVLGL